MPERQDGGDQRINRDHFFLVPQSQEIQVGGQALQVTSTQFRLLGFMVSSPGRAFSRGEPVELVIGAVVTERTVDQHVKELHRKLGPHGGRIETVRGFGSRFREEPQPPAG